MKRTTIRDVAAASGVSPATVSRVFSGEPTVSEAVVARVRASAKTLGYRPSMMARSLTSSRTNLIALVVGSLRNPFDASLVEHLSAMLHANGKRLLVVPADYGTNDPGAMVALDYQTDGVIVAAGHISQESSERFSRLGIPVVLFGRVFKAPGLDCIVADNHAGARQIGELLARSGARHLAFVRHVRNTFSDDERFAGLLAGLDGNAHVTIVKSTLENARENALSFLTGPSRPDAVFCANDVLAFGVLEGAAQLNLRVPDELMVAGFDDIPLASSPFYNLTTLRQPVEVIAAWIVRRLEDRIANSGLNIMVKRVPAQLVARRTTPCEIALPSGSPYPGQLMELRTQDRFP